MLNLKCQIVRTCDSFNCLRVFLKLFMRFCHNRLVLCYTTQIKSQSLILYYALFWFKTFKFRIMQICISFLPIAIVNTQVNIYPCGWNRLIE